MSSSQYERANYAVNSTPQFSMLSEDECDIILSSALEVLERTGADVESDAALRILTDGGAWAEGRRVHIPAHLAEWALRSAPSRIVVSDRNGNRCMHLEGQNVYYGPGPSTTYTIDPISGERRLPTKSDVVRAAIVADALPNISYAMDLGTISDVTPALSDLHAFQALVENTTKPIVHWAYGVEGCRGIIDMAAAVRGGADALQHNPYVVLYCESTPPLKHPGEAIDIAVFCAKANVPVIYTPCTFAGSVAPATMAGSLVIAVADFLVGLVAGQLTNAGAPFIMGGLITSMNMKSPIVSHGAAELSLLSAGLVAVAHRMGIPVLCAGGCSDAKIGDTQMAVEAAFSLLVAGLSGANLVQDLGYMESGTASSLELLTMDDEIVGMVKIILGGIAVDDDTMAVDVMDRVGPGGHYLADDHTMAHFRDFWRPTLIDRLRYDGWVEEGATSMGERIKKKVQVILADHKPEQLSSGVLQGIQAVVNKAESREATER